MEYILIEDVREIIEDLKRYVRPVGVGEHPFLDPDHSIRRVDFDISADGKTVNAGPGGLSFATSMKKFKEVLKFKKRHTFMEVEVNAISDLTPLPKFFRIVKDGDGHASLTVVEDIDTEAVIEALDLLADRMEKIGRIRL